MSTEADRLKSRILRRLEDCRALWPDVKPPYSVLTPEGALRWGLSLLKAGRLTDAQDSYALGTDLYLRELKRGIKAPVMAGAKAMEGGLKGLQEAKAKADARIQRWQEMADDFRYRNPGASKSRVATSVKAVWDAEKPGEQCSVRTIRRRIQ
ncbi:MAG: hypothetical protein ACSLE5_05525 [Porticoccaceae bacterium]